MSRAGRMATYEWQSIADEFLDYLEAFVETPDLDTPQAKAALKDASEAAAGAVAYAAYHPHCSFQVFLEYVNFGMSYDPGEDAPEEERHALERIDALCLSVLRQKAKWHGEAFHFARKKFAAQVQATPAASWPGRWPWSWTTPVATRSTRRARRRSSPPLTQPWTVPQPAPGRRASPSKPAGQRSAAHAARPGRRGPGCFRCRAGRPPGQAHHPARPRSLPEHPSPTRPHGPRRARGPDPGRPPSTPTTSRTH